MDVTNNMSNSDKASTQLLTEKPVALGEIWRAVEGRCDPFHHYELWSCLMRDYRRFPGQQISEPICDQCGRNCRDRSTWPTLDEYSDYEDFTLKQMQKKLDLISLVRKQKNHKDTGPRELTLTYSPKWFQDDIEAQAAFRLAETRLLKYYKDELLIYKSVGEYTKDGRAHLHIMYHLRNGLKFTDKNIKRAYPHWNAKIKVGLGNQGGHHALVKSVSDLSGYLEKDLDTAWYVYEHKNAALQEDNHSSSSSLHSQSAEIPTLAPSSQSDDAGSQEGDSSPR